MQEVIRFGKTVWRDMPGTAILEIKDCCPSEEKRHAQASIGVWRQRFGGTTAHLKHPCGPTCDFQFEHWSHLPDDTFLQLTWRFIPDRPIVRGKSQPDPDE
ncbi:MAG TPA: hypothetical protein VL485_01605 [Ktedonobacteraceae bacterium]|jgi:hypothetical protein|nr:hypothetical protein [Ktedonobacteraceae bacterium]